MLAIKYFVCLVQSRKLKANSHQAWILELSFEELRTPIPKGLQSLDLLASYGVGRAQHRCQKISFPALLPDTHASLGRSINHTELDILYLWHKS